VSAEFIAHYQVVSKIGEGGMGAVYRATDTKLNRDVAIKVLPPAFAEDSARMQRFEREAQVLASLNHPNIAAIYGIEQSAIVMELVEGEDLKGPLPVDTVIDYARQIAAGLEAAHEKGIVHRDLKPANIKVTPDGVVKLLDFGLAKAREESTSAASAAASPTISPTLSLAMTQAGMILGTAAYMSPEQARGKAVDRRADIWAFGVILYELLTGAMLFGGGETVSDSLAAVLTREPDFNALPKDTPPRLRRLIERCLRKDPKHRLRDIGDARLLLDEADPAAAAVAAPVPTRRWLAPAAGAAALLAGVLGFGWWKAAHREPELKPLIRLNVDLGPGAQQGPMASAWLSPDGTHLLFLSPQTNGGTGLWVRKLDQRNATLLAADAQRPFFSPDGQWVGFFGQAKLRKVALHGGVPETLCEIDGTGDGTWSDDGTIVFSLGSRGLMTVSQDGGTPKRLTETSDGRGSHRLPHFLPGGKAVLYTLFRKAGNWDASDVEVLWLQNGKRTPLIKEGYGAQYLASGHLLFLRENRVFAVRFDPAKAELRGTPAPVIEGLKANGSGAQLFSAANNGSLIYESGAAQSSWPVVWVDPSGKLTPLVDRAAQYRSPRFSPDGKLLAATVTGPKNDDLWVFDLVRQTSTQLTFDAPIRLEVVWTPDGKYLVFTTEGPPGTWLIRADGSGGARRLSETAIRPQSFTPDGRRIVSTGGGISSIPVDLSDPEHPRAGDVDWVIKEPTLHDAEISPDGRWVAFVLTVTGREELFVVPYRIGAGARGGRWRISRSGAKFPRWSRTARELFFRDPSGRIQVVEYTVNGESFSAGNPREWSPARLLTTGVVSSWDLAPDGKRAVAFPLPEGELEENGSLHITFLLNFFDELRRRIPLKP
jgi:Tol biopolymer transport system component/predicted Ser/Thr protein kinase